jgi:hypothetical protein
VVVVSDLDSVKRGRKIPVGFEERVVLATVEVDRRQAVGGAR